MPDRRLESKAYSFNRDCAREKRLSRAVDSADGNSYGEEISRPMKLLFSESEL
jgi:hypothetical protein